MSLLMIVRNKHLNKKPANLAVNRLNIKIKRFASIIQPSAPLPEQPL